MILFIDFWAIFNGVQGLLCFGMTPSMALVTKIGAWFTPGPTEYKARTLLAEFILAPPQ